MSSWRLLIYMCIILNSISGRPEPVPLELEERTLANEGVADAILYGYVIDPDSPNYLGRGNIIFKVDRQNDLSISSNAYVTVEYEYSDSQHTAAKNIASAMEVSGCSGAFASSATMKVSRTSSSSIKTVRIDAMVKAVKYEVSSKGSFRTYPAEFLTEDFKKSVKDLSNEDIEKKIGIFYATKLKLGGEVKKTYTMQATASDTESSVYGELTARYGSKLFGSSAKASVGTQTRSSNSKASMKISWAAQGGDTTVWLGKQFSNTGSNTVDNIAKIWAATFTEDNLYPSDFELAPIWDLIKKVDAKKGEAYKKYLENKWKEANKDFKPSKFLSGEKKGKIPVAYALASSYSNKYGTPEQQRKKLLDSSGTTELHTLCDDNYEWIGVQFSEACWVEKVKLVNGKKSGKHLKRLDKAKIYVRDGNKDVYCGQVRVRKGSSVTDQTYEISCPKLLYGTLVTVVNDRGMCTELANLEAHGICGRPRN